MTRRNPWLALIFLAALTGHALADVELRGDPDHSGLTEELLRPPLELAWEYPPGHPPRPAFSPSPHSRRACRSGSDGSSRRLGSGSGNVGPR